MTSWISEVNITKTSKWARWRLKSPAPRLLTQPFIQGADQRKHQSSASLTFVWGIHRWPVNSPHRGPVTRKMFPCDDVVMKLPTCQRWCIECHPVAYIMNLNNVGHPGKPWPAYVTHMFVVALYSNGRQTISNHHDNLSVSTESYESYT